MNEFDELLNSIGASVVEEHAEEFIPAVVSNTQVEPAETNLSENDLEDILAGYGFREPEEAEVINEDETDNQHEQEEAEEEHNNTEESRDLDAEEDADWENAFASGELRQVTEEVSQTRENPPEESLIPLNSPTLLLDDSTSRFSGTEWYREIQRQRIILAGLGGIGSNTALQLARMSPAALFLYDNDIVETVNMSGQLFSRNDIGMYKADAVSNMIKLYTSIQNVYAISERFTENSEAGDIMICGFDNMEARRIFFNAWQTYVWKKPEEERYKCLYLDGRLSIDCLQVLCIKGDDTYNISRYKDKFLFTDEEADETICSMKQTTYLACMIGSFIVNLFTNFVAGTLDPVIPYDLPFFTEYDAQNMIFKTEY